MSDEGNIRETVRDRRVLSFKLAGEAGVDPRTAERWLRGFAVIGAVENALRAATERLSVAAEVERYRSDAA